MKKRINIMDEQSSNYQKIQYKNWIKKRFILEVDIYSLSLTESLLFVRALQEVSNELIDTIQFVHVGTHNIVPFKRGNG